MPSSVFYGAQSARARVWAWSAIVAGCGLAVLNGCDRRGSVAPVAPSLPAAQRISVTCDVRFGRDREIVSVALTLEAGATVADALEEAARQRGWTIGKRGSDGTYFVLSIDGVENGGAGKDNWVFFVNGELAQQSAGVTPVASSDVVLWRYGSYP